jgi:type I restriction-modification system DNA methylase subunit
MNKQQLAQKIWASANQMRSKIEASEYKDFILGFMFYKYLSDKEVEFLKENDYDDELLKTVTDDDEETVRWIQENIGYFISYKDLFSTWLSMGKDFDVSNVRDALSAFSRLISDHISLSHFFHEDDSPQFLTLKVTLHEVYKILLLFFRHLLQTVLLSIHKYTQEHHIPAFHPSV